MFSIPLVTKITSQKRGLLPIGWKKSLYLIFRCNQLSDLSRSVFPDTTRIPFPFYNYVSGKNPPSYAASRRRVVSVGSCRFNPSALARSVRPSPAMDPGLGKRPSWNRDTQEEWAFSSSGGPSLCTDGCVCSLLYVFGGSLGIC